MTLILSATFLAPGFGWQLAGGVMGDALAMRDHGTQGHTLPMHEMGDHPSANHDMSGHHAHAMATTAHDAPCTDCDHGDQAPCAVQHHHCCPGHVLGHLASSVALGHGVLPIGAFLAVDRDTSEFSSRSPEGLERPPKSAFA
ncbi:MAG: hypothetical protein L6Q40_06940 [Azonexus sp.]|nr:hypothetical protein [Azonexus sp.]